MGHCAEFTGDGGLFAGKVHGYRATNLGGERAFYVLCQCSERDWMMLKPAFERAMGSMAPGAG
jgi:hypothetical protein